MARRPQIPPTRTLADRLRNPPQSGPLGALNPGANLAINASDVFVGPNLTNVPRPTLAEAPPLALLPMRLEYRFVTRGVPITVQDTADVNTSIARAQARNSGRSTEARRKLATELNEIRATARRDAPKTRRPVLAEREELWLRWYPDDGFAEDGIAPISSTEQAALDVLNQAISGKDWWDNSDPKVSSAWQAFAGEVGPARAVHLKRTEGNAPDPEFQARIGRIAALPASVTLFAIAPQGDIEQLGEGADIPPNAAAAPSPVSYTPDALEAGGWLVDFEVALAQGMGLKLSDPDSLRKAKAADWIVAVGLAPGGSHDEMEALLRAGIANGEFAVLPQDAATNNAPGETSHYANPANDIPGFTQSATQAEQGVFDPRKQAAADLLGEAFGVDPQLLRQTIDGADLAFEDARAMMRAIGPGLLDDSLDGVTAIPDVSENAFIDVMAAMICARGVLPAVRFGDNAYGVLPMTPIHDLEIPPEGSLPDAERKVSEFLKQYARLARAFLPAEADSVVPVIRPGDPQASDKLSEILRTNRVSTRVEVSEAGASTSKPITCPYVYGTNAARQPANYLEALRTQPIKSLVDPDKDDRSWPLLYRLARVSLIRNTSLLVATETLNIVRASVGTLSVLSRSEQQAVKAVQTEALANSVSGLAEGARVNSLASAAAAILQRRNATFASALLQLEAVAARPQGTAHLEVLLMEVLDTFQHRIDAFVTGLAYARLRRNRAAGQTGLSAGYYGFLGRLRPESATGTSDGYIQAPSTGQAVSAAVMRSAHLRHRANGAFTLDLGSHRVKNALLLMDLVSKGHTLSEALGMRGERWLHDNKLDVMIYRLRNRFPITDPNDNSDTARRLFDGIALIEARLGSTEAELKQLQKKLLEDLDGFSDVVMAEAVHQRAIGLASGANAWMQVLAGHPPPGEPSFIKTNRSGQASEHRVTALINQATPGPNAGPRAVAEPALARLAESAMPGFAQAVIRLSATRTADNGAGGTIDLKLGPDLNMQPIDLVIGGISELQLRAKNTLVRRLLQTPGLQAGLAAAGGLAALASGETTLSVDMNVGNPSLEKLLQNGEAIRAAVLNGRPMEPSDLSASADAAAGQLSEAQSVDMIRHAVVQLAARARRLSHELTSRVSRLTSAIAGLEVDIMSAQICIGANEADDVIANCLVAAETRRRTLANVLAEIAIYGEPSALRVFTVEEALGDNGATIARLTALKDRVAARLATLIEAHSNTASFETALEATARRDELINALQNALDKDAIPILPPYPRSQPNVRPALLASVEFSDALSDWAAVRSGVARTEALATLMPGAKINPVAPSATGADALNAPDDDPRPESEAPKSRHFGSYLAKRSVVTGSNPVAGFVCDEWIEQRPSDTQVTGIAVNYDSPQNESPHAILLCVPPSQEWKSWSQERAVGMVVETINWMKIRALPTDRRFTPTSLLPGSNQIAYKNQKSDDGARLPDRRPRIKHDDWFVGDAGFATVANADVNQPAGASAAGIVERLGFKYIKE